MAFNRSEFIEAFELGLPTSIESARDLNTVETTLAEHYLPITWFTPLMAEESLGVWNTRQPLKEAISGRFFRGLLSDITVSPYETPAEEAFGLSKRLQSKLATADAIGFLVTASLSSTAAREAGSTQKPVWLMRPSPNGSPYHLRTWIRTVGAEQLDNHAERIYKASVIAARGGGSLGTTSYRKNRRATLDDGFERR
jgi:hypothetical protein